MQQNELKYKDVDNSCKQINGYLETSLKRDRGNTRTDLDENFWFWWGLLVN